MKSNSLATILLMIPVLTVPALAIFGIPQFTPVVASPLDEGIGQDREKGIGNSARLSHDELFDDVEGISPELGARSERTSPVRHRVSSSSPQRSSRLQPPEARATPSWGDDLERVADGPNPTRLASSAESGDITTSERVPKPAMNAERLARYERSPRQSGKKSDPDRSATLDDSSHRITQIAYSEEFSDHENRADAVSGERQRTPRRAKLREPAAEELTWTAAVERLNELEIRSFRLEPGPRLGLFVFICSYTAPDAPSVSYRFEAEADQPLKAVQKVLEQIVEWRQRR